MTCTIVIPSGTGQAATSAPFGGEGTVEWDDKYLPFDIGGGWVSNNGTAKGSVTFTMAYRNGDNHHSLTGQLSNSGKTLSGSWDYVDDQEQPIFPGDGGTFKLHLEGRTSIRALICSG